MKLRVDSDQLVIRLTLEEAQSLIEANELNSQVYLSKKLRSQVKLELNPEIQGSSWFTENTQDGIRWIGRFNDDKFKEFFSHYLSTEKTGKEKKDLALEFDDEAVSVEIDLQKKGGVKNLYGILKPTFE